VNSYQVIVISHSFLASHSTILHTLPISSFNTSPHLSALVCLMILTIKWGMVMAGILSGLFPGSEILFPVLNNDSPESG
jgi:thiamine transporter ThiT